MFSFLNLFYSSNNSSNHTNNTKVTLPNFAILTGDSTPSTVIAIGSDGSGISSFLANLDDTKIPTCKTISNGNGKQIFIQEPPSEKFQDAYFSGLKSSLIFYFGDNLPKEKNTATPMDFNTLIDTLIAKQKNVKVFTLVYPDNDLVYDEVAIDALKAVNGKITMPESTSPTMAKKLTLDIINTFTNALKPKHSATPSNNNS